MPLSNSPRWWCPRTRSSDRSSKHLKANATWQSPGKGAGVTHSSVHLPPDFLSHPAGHLHAPDGWHDGGRWPHSTRGEVPSNFHNMLSAWCILIQLSTRVWKRNCFVPVAKMTQLFSPPVRYPFWEILPKMWTIPRAPSSMSTMFFPQVRCFFALCDSDFSYLSACSCLLHQLRYSGKYIPAYNVCLPSPTQEEAADLTPIGRGLH